MTHQENESLYALEHLMDEFFNPTTSNIRKRDIEIQLNSFSIQQDSWKLCLYFVTHTSSQFVSMYALSTIESVINRQWLNLRWENRAQIRTTIYNFLIEKENTTPLFIRNKLAKLLVDIARYDWPHFYPEFFTNILHLLQSEKGQLLGLILLKITSEEFMSPRFDLTTFRKDELTRLLQQNIPQVLHLLTSILDHSGNKPQHAATATPPPSPTHPSSTPNFAEQICVASFRPDFKSITREALAATQHIFTWVPMTEIPMQLIKSIFQFTHISSYAQDDDDMCVLAMSTLNELLYRKCIPPESQNLFVEIYRNTLHLLQDLTCPTSGRIETIGTDFMDKFSELLALLMEQHLWRLECEPDFSALDFLGLLFQLTMQLPSAQCYLRCLSVWSAFIKQIKPQNANKYSDALVSLVTAVLNKMQFTYNYTQLEETNGDNDNDENETDWDMFLKTSIEIIAVVAEYALFETFNQIFVEWRNANEVYKMLQDSVDRQSCTIRLEHSEIQRLHCILKDLSSLTQTLARLSTLFTDQDADFSKSTPPVLSNLLSKLMQSASIATNVRFYHMKMVELRIVNDFIEVHSHFLAALKTWIPFLSLNEEINSKNLQELINFSLPILRSGQSEPSKISHSAAHLLLALSTSVFPPSLVTLPPVVEFLHMASTIKYNNKQTTEVVNNALCNILIRPWGELSQQDTTKRNQLITGFFDMLTKDFRELTPHVDQHKIREIVNDVLPILSNIIVHCKNYPTTSKKLLYMGIKNSIDHALVLFPSYSRYPEVSDKVLCLFLNVLGVLQQQLGVESTKHAVEIFLEVAVSEQQVKCISGIDKLLQIFQLVVESPGSTYRSFLPGILQLCLQNVYPFVICQANEHPDVIISLLTLLHSILSHRWNYFYLSQVKMGHSPGCSDLSPAPDSPQQPEQLLAVLQIFGQSLLQPDINTFRTSLTALEDLNTKWKLYHKTLFKEHLLSQFLTVLLHTLLGKSHNLLNDDIFLGIYNMTSVDFHAFFTTFLPHFLQNIDGILENHKELLQQGFTRETDMPTFVQHLNRFINDLRCFKLSNESNTILASH